MALIVSLADPQALSTATSGGKGVNLARMAQAGFRVPPGFIVTTEAFAALIDADGLGRGIADAAAALPYDDPVALEAACASIRAQIEQAVLPAAFVAGIADAYRAIGDEPFVAVRSSGTAEDLADASFAGQHDTYLDVRGADAVAAAVLRCWASLYTARAAIYRHQRGFDHDAVRIAVVVQKMVAADVAGVMFTGNPITTATDESVINASWGLGEALVQGIVTPDQIIIRNGRGTVIEQQMGDKALRIVRDGAAGGVRTEAVPPEDRQRFCLDSPMIVELGRLGEAVQAYYGGFPQDIEWAIEAGELHLLQARPITGVEFSWDADVDAAHTQDCDVNSVWTRAFGDALASGVVSPLTCSSRFPIFSGRNMRRMWQVLGHDDLAEIRAFKYWKGELYYNVDVERRFVERLVPPQLRAMLVDFIPPVQQQALIDGPFDEAKFLRSLLAWQMGNNPDSPLSLPAEFDKWRRRTDYEGLSYEALRGLTDEELIAYSQRMTAIFGEWNDLMWAPFLVTLRLMMSALRWMTASWYDGGDPQLAFTQLVAGATQRTDTQIENEGLNRLARMIRRSPVLRAALDAHEDAGFFTALEGSEEGRGFLAKYRAWIVDWGHRGHADRDYLYPRRAEDPSIDVRAFKLMMHAEEGVDHRAAELAISRARDAMLEAVCANIAAKPGGPQRAEYLRALFTLTHKYLATRDNERARPTDVLTYSRKRGYVEIGRRLYERGLIDKQRDMHFLSELELFQLFRGQVNDRALLKAKIRGRERDCERMLARQANMPMHLQRNRAVDLDHPPQDASDGVHRGTATAPGTITGTARVIMDHADMGRVRPGEILVTHSTDPGWNPVFGIIKGVVIETGGMLSHASCLAREYGFPAVHLPHAAQLIADGARISVDGNAGTVTILDLTATPVQDEEVPLKAEPV